MQRVSTPRARGYRGERVPGSSSSGHIRRPKASILGRFAELPEHHETPLDRLRMSVEALELGEPHRSGTKRIQSFGRDLLYGNGADEVANRKAAVGAGVAVGRKDMIGARAVVAE